MLQVDVGKTGTAPGTTTISIGPGGQASLVGLEGLPQLPYPVATQNPGVVVRNSDGRRVSPTSLGEPMGRKRPGDFERARHHLDYLPHHAGWIVGDLRGLGVTEEPLPQLDPAESVKLVAHYKAREAQASALAKEEQIKSSQSSRFWTAVAGVVGVAGLVIAVVQLRK